MAAPVSLASASQARSDSAAGDAGGDALRGKLIFNWHDAYRRARAYLSAVSVDPERHEDLARRAVETAAGEGQWRDGEGAVAATLRALRRLLVGGEADERDPEEAFVRWRLEGALGEKARGAVGRGAPVISSMPPLTRGHMVPNHFERRRGRRFLVHGWARGGESVDRSVAEFRQQSEELRRKRQTMAWPPVAARRRLLMTFLILIPSIIASGFMMEVLPYRERTLLELPIVLCFGALFGWVSIGFWTATIGFFLLWRRDRFSITESDPEPTNELPEGARTAVLMPICEEPVERIIAGLKATYRSVERTGCLDRFDFFILSDSASPATIAREEEAWFDCCREIGGFGRIFYRRRRVRIERKSGNIADFCRRWGHSYRYMVCLDADSVMAGESLVRLVRLMERNPNAGMIQTAPVAVNRKSMFARIQQFASRLYGPMFAAGLHYWQLGDGQYWGHNAIIRVAPFMEFCALPRLPGRPPLGGEILSHDFVEAALMGRAGWGMWLAYDLGGSYEETPSTLLEEMKRDRRWCQGNLQHVRLVRIRGFVGAHRALFLNGVLSYVSALLWFFFLTFSTAEAVWQAVRSVDYFPSGRSLFPEWPIWRPDWMYSLLAVTFAILFLPKILAALVVLIRGERRRSFGGTIRLLCSVMIEIVASALFAPVRMAFHTRFVITNLLGRTVAWKSQPREDAETTWREAMRHHGLDTIIATVWAIGVHSLNPDYFWWLIPIVGALIVSIPVSVLASRAGIGERARRLGLLLIPEEKKPPIELQDLYHEIHHADQRRASLPEAERDGFVRMIVDPTANAVHRGLLGTLRSLDPAIRARREDICRRLLEHGPSSLDNLERRDVMIDPQLVSHLHAAVWGIEDDDRARIWLGNRI